MFNRISSTTNLWHVPKDDILTVLGHVRRVLKPGGLFVLTVDLFLDLLPFTRAEANKFGQNVSIRWLVENSGLDLVAGRPEELYGFEEFDAVRVLGKLPELRIGSRWPALVQTLVLRK
ncbi:MAG: hypothetical protein DMG97_40285 [Acidobacteria bacterium]|nr:MAG: hypothetical protein DMG97_40285 [Acidobacteriota bacterium]